MLAWLRARPIDTLLRDAVDSAVKYVLDGARTWRFDLNDPSVDSDERSSVGTKLQYHVIEGLGLKKEPPLDTTIADRPVEIKGTVRKTWMIPREGQCEITLMIRIDTRRHEFEARLMRAHRAWLTGKKGNRDLKRSPRVDAVHRYSLVVAPPTPLPPEPLRMLDDEQVARVFGPGGLKGRLVELFASLPETVIPRGSIAVVGAGLHDPLRRAREAKVPLREKYGLVALVGTWPAERELARRMGFDISGEAWVAVYPETFHAHELDIPVPD
ncbi:NaeI family type II restriction endonuclease [Microbacterium bovistercoris]|uniref:NaeI family type II restriction endonuclease n=1 Tax=Microbacterium bovistercoris TaxID=2293570 RepID=UPI001FE9EC88|nr:NaeI family type II restriction endonuclease [Microbacterium bovistercoris]